MKAMSPGNKALLCKIHNYCTVRYNIDLSICSLRGDIVHDRYHKIGDHQKRWLAQANVDTVRACLADVKYTIYIWYNLYMYLEPSCRPLAEACCTVCHMLGAHPLQGQGHVVSAYL